MGRTQRGEKIIWSIQQVSHQILESLSLVQRPLLASLDTYFCWSLQTLHLDFFFLDLTSLLVLPPRSKVMCVTFNELPISMSTYYDQKSAFFLSNFRQVRITYRRNAIMKSSHLLASFSALRNSFLCEGVGGVFFDKPCKVIKVRVKAIFISAK